MHPRSFVKLSIAALIMFLFAVCVWVMTPRTRVHGRDSLIP